MNETFENILNFYPHHRSHKKVVKLLTRIKLCYRSTDKFRISRKLSCYRLTNILTSSVNCVDYFHWISCKSDNILLFKPHQNPHSKTIHFNVVRYSVFRKNFCLNRFSPHFYNENLSYSCFIYGISCFTFFQAFGYLWNSKKKQQRGGRECS